MNLFSTNKNIRLIKKVLRRDQYFSTRLTYAGKKIRGIYYPMANKTYNSTEDMNDKLQMLKGKTKIKLYKILSSYFDEMK